MASIIDAFEESFHDNHALTKFIIFAIPVYYCVDLYSKNDDAFWFVSALVFILLFGFMLKCTSNVRNGKNYVMPSFNIFSMFWSGIKGLVAIGPILAILSWLAAAACNFLNKYFGSAGQLFSYTTATIAAETKKYLWENRLDEEAGPEDDPV